LSTPYLGSIKTFSFNYAPKGWALCNGQLLAINQNQALFSLLGTTYGGNGVQTFALPNLQGNFALCFGGNYVQGQVSGENSHTLIVNEMASHFHTPLGSSDAATTGTPTGSYPAAQPASTGILPYATSGGADVALATGSSSTGGGGAHENRPPYLTLNFCIALTGIFPSRN
jgi:microcystin-dependent protein